MKTFTALMFFALIAPATVASVAAAPASARIEPPHYMCERGPLSHVALRAEAAPCCAGQFGCPQLLSNTGLIKPKRDNHT